MHMNIVGGDQTRMSASAFVSAETSDHPKK